MINEKLIILIIFLFQFCTSAPVIPGEVNLLSLNIPQYDSQICSENILKSFYDGIHSNAGKTAGCDVTLEKVLSSTPVSMDDICKCVSGISTTIRNFYDTNFDCVIAKGVWNIKKTTTECFVVSQKENSIVEMIKRHSAQERNVTKCIENVSCLNGKCIQNKCVCETGRGSLNWGPVHPLWIGDDCSIPWCPNECSGHGSCDTSSGICYCDSTHLGISCSELHLSTKVTVRNPSEPVMVPPKKDSSSVVSSCLEAVNNLLPINPNENIYIPQCTEDGEWISVQCSPPAKRCWCVQKDGKELKGTSRNITNSLSPEECFNIAKEAEEGFEGIGKGIAVNPINRNLPCDKMFCGPNGFCDVNSVPISCKCIGGYTGVSCKVPPPTPTSTPKEIDTSSSNSTIISSNSTTQQ